MIHIIRLTILKAFHSFDNNQQTNPAIKGNMLTAGMIKKPDIGISHMNSAITCTKIAKKTSPIIMSFFFIFFSSPPIILPFRHDCRINSSVQVVQLHTPLFCCTGCCAGQRGGAVAGKSPREALAPAPHSALELCITKGGVRVSGASLGC